MQLESEVAKQTCFPHKLKYSSFFLDILLTISKPMKGKSLFFFLLAATAFVAVQPAIAQTEKVMKRTTVQGQQVSTPYITFDELRTASITGRNDNQSQAKSSKSKAVEGTFDRLYVISSLSEVYRHLGEPQSVEQGGQADILRYGGLRLVYIKAEAKAYLKEVEMTGSEWALAINGVRVSPGMDTTHLSSEIRSAVESYEKRGSHAPKSSRADAVAPIHVDGAETETRLLVRVNRASGSIESVLFHRLI